MIAATGYELVPEAKFISEAWTFLPLVARFGFSYQQKATTSNGMLRWKHPQKTKTSNKMHLLVLAFYISKTRKSNEEQQKETNGKWKHAPKTNTSNKEQQMAFFIPILIHSHQFWTYGRWLISRAMKSQKEQRRATKSNEKAAKSYEQQQKATTDIGAGKTKTGKNNREEQRKAQKV